MFRWLHRFQRAVYHANRASRTAEVLSSGDPGRMVKLAERRILYRLLARLLGRRV